MLEYSGIPQGSSYSVLTFITDELRRTEVPVGIALWNNKNNRVQIRIASHKEKLKGFKHEWIQHLEMISSQMHFWISEGHLPYGRANLKPQNDDWWKHLRNLLVHRVRLSEPKAIDCRDVPEEAD